MAEMVMTPLGTRLPDGWRLERLGPLCAKIGSGATPKGGSAVYEESGASFIRSQNVLDHTFSRTGLAYINESAASKLRGVSVEARDVLLNITGDGDTIARCCVVPSEILPARINQHVAIIRTGSELIPEYLQRYLSHPLIREYMLNHNSGGSRRALTKAHIESFAVVIPPPPEQCAIASVLGALDDKIATNEIMIQCALKLADAHFAKAVHREASEATLGELSSTGTVSFGDGYRTKKSEHGQPGLPILRVAEVGDFDIFPAYEDFVSVEYRSAMNQKISRPGDVVLTTKGTVGRATIMPRDLPEFAYSPQVCYFRVDTGSSRVSAEFLYLWLRSRAFWDQASSRKGQTDMADYLSLTELRTLRIQVLSEQAAAELQRIIGPLLRKAESCRGENRALANLRNTLLPKLISGELRLKDATQMISGTV